MPVLPVEPDHQDFLEMKEFQEETVNLGPRVSDIPEHQAIKGRKANLAQPVPQVKAVPLVREDLPVRKASELLGIKANVDHQDPLETQVMM